MPAARRRSGAQGASERGRASSGEGRRRTSSQRSDAKSTPKAGSRSGGAKSGDSASGGSKSGQDSGERQGNAAGSRLTARDAARKAGEYVREMTGHDPEGVTSLSRTDDGWRVGIEVVESRRIPDSTDILAVYHVDVDSDGDLISYKRDDRYYRGRADKE
ncbi:MAG TPA: gas vesicle protein [Streptomyces sp.]